MWRKRFSRYFIFFFYLFIMFKACSFKIEIERTLDMSVLTRTLVSAIL